MVDSIDLLDDRLTHRLQERLKELSALHKAAELLQHDRISIDELLNRIVELIPPAWQYPESTAACITVGKRRFASPRFTGSSWAQEAPFKTRRGTCGAIVVVYLDAFPDSDEGPFLREERALIDSLARMVCSWVERREARIALRRANTRLEESVRARTKQLEQANFTLQSEINVRRHAEQRIRRYQRQLRQLVARVSQTEDRERRIIATDIHDNIGQALAMVKMQLLQLHGEAMFYGLEGRIEEISRLVDLTIRYMRGLVVSISPPTLYELGLDAAIEAMIEQFREKHRQQITFSTTGQPSMAPSEVIKGTLFRATRELLTNVIKHAGARNASVTITWAPLGVSISVADDGVGFDKGQLRARMIANTCFGIFNLREQMRELGGTMQVSSDVGSGTTVVLHIPLENNV